MPSETRRSHSERTDRTGDSLWYKDAVIYELRTRSFFDSDDDGIGDLQGLTQKLDYLQDLGVDTLWVLPFYPSPLRDDGYDISDYTAVHSDIGTLRDFKHFLKEAHRRGLRVITELVLNHTSDQHPWFQEARQARPKSPKRDFYVWSDSPERFSEARIIFKDFENSNWAWDPVANAYYWHRFYSHQPDLNFDNPRVRKALTQVVDFWLGMGVDGLRLDAIPYLYEREGTNCENLPEVHEFLRQLRSHIDQRFPNRMLLAEANQWPEDTAEYFGEGDECNMAYHFPIMPRLFMAIQMEDRFPISDILRQTPAIPPSAQWAMFLRNHDELTLEMVTDEERDYMYRVYASDQTARLNLGIRRRLAPLLGNDRKKIELMNALLFSMPGTPIIYYGDEIGMGDNFYLGDRNGVRTPMQWNGDRNAGFSRANPQQLYLPLVIDPEYHYETVNVETQQNNPHSLLWWMKRLIALRKQYAAFGRGSLELLDPQNPCVLAFLREWEDQKMLVVCNLARSPQYVELDLGDCHGLTPVELFGGSEFPVIRKRPYLVTLGPHSFYWFSLERHAPAMTQVGPAAEALKADRDWREVVVGEKRKGLERLLPGYLDSQRWFGGKARKIRGVTVVDTLSFPSSSALLTLIRVAYADESVETYCMPIAYATGLEGARLASNKPEAIITRLAVTSREEEGYLFDATVDPDFGRTLLSAVARKRRVKGGRGVASGGTTRVFRRLFSGDTTEVTVGGLEQSNTSLRFGHDLILKLFRRLQDGVSPDQEIGRALTERVSFPHSPPVAGWIEYAGRLDGDGHQTSRKGGITTLAVVHGFMQNEGDCWRYTLDWLGRFYERVLSRSAATAEAPPLPPNEIAVSAETPQEVGEWMGGYVDWVRLLGRRTAELHLALASIPDDPDFSREPFSRLYQRSLYQSMRNLTGQVFRLLKQRVRRLPKDARREARFILERENRLLQRFRAVLDRRLGGVRIRCHGDYHLGQVLFTGKDFVIIDFEGEPARPISERKIKRSPLRDVAGMLRSFHYAAYAALPGYTRQTTARSIDLPKLEPWSRFWHRWAERLFVEAYMEELEGAKLLPTSRQEIDLLLDVLTLEKAVYEVGYEINNRPLWSKIPLSAIVTRLTESGTDT